MRYADTSRYSGNVVRINQPESSTETSEQAINLGPGLLVQFTFDLSDFIFGRSANDLVMKYPQGSSLVMRGFFAEEGHELPDFMLEDGTILPGNDFLAIMELAVSANVETALNDLDASQGSGLHFMLDFEHAGLDGLLPHNPAAQPSGGCDLFAAYAGESDAGLTVAEASAFNDFAALNDMAAFAEQSALLNILLANG
ncbi:MAG: hypothetical protein LBM00_03445 [Deltaproteobacteria bacterium]|jgi:hypothetical protein|nr:hypothetical protein [Deltaproteobacteria bacterium]